MQTRGSKPRRNCGEGKERRRPGVEACPTGISSRRRARDHPQAPTVARILHIRRRLQVMEAGSGACPISSSRYDYPVSPGGDGRRPNLVSLHSYPPPLLLVSVQGVLIPITPRGGKRRHMQHLPRLAPHLPQHLPQKDLPLQPFLRRHHLPPRRVAQRLKSHVMRPQAHSLLLPSLPRLCHGVPDRKRPCLRTVGASNR